MTKRQLLLRIALLCAVFAVFLTFGLLFIELKESPSAPDTSSPLIDVTSPLSVLTAFPELERLPGATNITATEEDTGGVPPFFECRSDQDTANTPGIVGPNVSVSYSFPSGFVAAGLSRYSEPDEAGLNLLFSAAPNSCPGLFGFTSQQDIDTQVRFRIRTDAPSTIRTPTVAYTLSLFDRASRLKIEDERRELSTFSNGWLISIRTSPSVNFDAEIETILKVVDQRLRTEFTTGNIAPERADSANETPSAVASIEEYLRDNDVLPKLVGEPGGIDTNADKRADRLVFQVSSIIPRYQCTNGAKAENGQFVRINLTIRTEDFRQVDRWDTIRLGDNEFAYYTDKGSARPERTIEAFNCLERVDSLPEGAFDEYSVREGSVVLDVPAEPGIVLLRIGGVGSWSWRVD